MKTNHWYERIPHAVTMLFMIIVFVTLLTYIIPAGEFKRALIEGRNRVIPGSYSSIPSTPIGFLQMFKAIPLGFKAAIEVMFVVFSGGIMFGVMEETKAIENAVGTFVHTIGREKKYLAVVLMTFIYGALGVFVGYEHNIALIPIAAVVSLALGGDLVLAAGISVGAVTLGFGLSPINPYTVGIGHKIGELPLGVPQNLIPFITQTAAGIRKELAVFGDDYPTPDGTAVRDYIHVVDLAKAHIAALKRLMEKRNKATFEYFNIGTGKGSSVLEVINAFEKVNNLKLNYKIVGRREGDIVAAYADTTKANKELNWKTEICLEEALASAWQWQLKQG